MLRIFSILFFCSIISWGQVCSSLLSPIMLKDKCQYASSIVYGEIVDTKTSWDSEHRNIYTLSTLKIYESIKGNVAQEIVLEVEGGQVGDRLQINSSSPKLQIGNEGVFFLKPSAIVFDDYTAVYKLATAIQGFVKLNKSNGELQGVFERFASTEDIKQEIADNTMVAWKKVQSRPLVNVRKSTLATNAIPIIERFTPLEISAGTKSVLTINGANFGNSRGTVGFRNADDGGSSFADALSSQIISWSDNEIRVEVPFNAGTGDIRVTNATDESGFSSTDIEIPYSFSNFHTSDGQAFQPLLFDKNGNGGYNFVYHTEFAQSEALALFEDSFEFWQCETGINFTFSGTTDNDRTADDGESVIRFDNGSELEPGILGAVITRVQASCSLDNKAAISEQDYIWNDSTNWYFGTGTPRFNQVDFKSIALHEHGHAHQISHVIDQSAVMHYVSFSGTVNYELSDKDREAAQFTINEFLKGSQCRGLDVMTLAPNSTPVFDNNTLPNDQEVQANETNQYVVQDFTNGVIVNDSCNQELMITQSPVEGTVLNVGQQIISLTATNTQSSSSNYQFTVTVNSNNGLSIEETVVNTSKEIIVYPNPVQNILNIDGGIVTKAVLITLNGEVVAEFSDNNFDMQPFSSGVYFLNMIVDGKETVKKVVKN